ncbi:MAG: hypothetical protein ACFFDH_06165 [Promethearchaeota archaeon]
MTHDNKDVFGCPSSSHSSECTRQKRLKKFSKNINNSVLKENHNKKKYVNKILDIQTIKNEIKKTEWKRISSEWAKKYRSRFSAPFTHILLNPEKDCSKGQNPLYLNNEWLKYLYEDMDLSFRQIAKVCDVDKNTIIYWAQKHGIPKKEDMHEWIDNNGYINVYTPKGYFHPELVPKDRGEGRFVRKKHQLIMEEYLKKHSNLEISKKCLIDGKYLKTSCPVHHIDFNKQNNEIKNLWVFENINQHLLCHTNLLGELGKLRKLGKITFKNGKYYLQENFNIHNLSRNEVFDLLKPRGDNYFEDIKNVKKELKKIDWNNLSSSWIVKYRQNQFQSYIDISLDPYSDCSDTNPLYRHKKWLDRVVSDSRFNLSDSRLGELCGISKDQARGWRRRLDVSRGRDWGFKRFIKTNGRVFIKPTNYHNPVAIKNKGWVLEHRYVIEQFLNLKSQIGSKLANRCLNNQGFLKSNIQIHHINFDPSDNRIENLFILFSEKEHKTLEFSLFQFVEKLLDTKQIRFHNGKYLINV